MLSQHRRAAFCVIVPRANSIYASSPSLSSNLPVESSSSIQKFHPYKNRLHIHSDITQALFPKSTLPVYGPQHDPFWSRLQDEARLVMQHEPPLASFLTNTILNHYSLNSALSFHLASKLACQLIPFNLLNRLIQTVIQHDFNFYNSVKSDLLAIADKDPACTRLIDALLYYKGFHALQAHRIAHILWLQNRISLANYLQSRVNSQLHVDIHPAASIGSAVIIDHATGIHIGETAVIGDHCSLFHQVTLGEFGKTHGQRHPVLGNGVLVGAGATLLGDIRIENGAQIGAGSLVIQGVPAHSTAVGIPARLLQGQDCSIRGRNY